MRKISQLKAQREIPQTYVCFWRFDIRQYKETITLSVWGVIILLAAWVGFLSLARVAQPAVFAEGILFKVDSISASLVFIIEVLAVTGLMLVLHEGLHGLFFWLFSGERPRFALKLYYAYAAAPGWYFPRWQYFITSLAPLIGITLIGVAALFWLPAFCAMPAFLLLVFNTSGAVGDMWVALRLLVSPRATFAKDYGDRIEFFKPVLPPSSQEN